MTDPPISSPILTPSGQFAGMESHSVADTMGKMEPNRSSLAPFIMSMGTHLVILVLLGAWIGRTSKGTGSPVERPIGIAIVKSLPDRTQYVDVATITPKPNSKPDPLESNLSSALAPPKSMVPPLDLDGVLKSVTASPSPASARGLAGMAELGDSDFGTSSNPVSTESSEQATAMVFGVSGTGSRFVYVFDRSDSMNGYGGKPLRAAKGELLRSLKSLTDRQQFQIIFYNNKPSAMRVSDRGIDMIDGDESSMMIARRHVASIAAFGGTEHRSALNMALRLGPDVIFFLTDARIPRLSSSELGLIQRRAQRGGTTIHAIEFGAEPDSPPDSFLRELAAMNLGEYRYVNVRALEPTGELTP